VKSVISGYAGGTVAHPTYEQVCAGTTGHAEVVQVAFDPQATSYEEILDVFFSIHDPTTLNRQGADVGTQYRSVILYHDERQRQIAQRKIAEIEAAGTWDNPIVTEVIPLETFYEAEAYHQDYFARNPRQGYCRVVIAPKVAKFRQHFVTQLKR
jgi:peptide-methionine (S)-S-oxide reductase